MRPSALRGALSSDRVVEPLLPRSCVRAPLGPGPPQPHPPILLGTPRPLGGNRASTKACPSSHHRFPSDMTVDLRGGTTTCECCKVNRKPVMKITQSE